MDTENREIEAGIWVERNRIARAREGRLADALAEIERLLAARNECERQYQAKVDEACRLMDQNERLRAALIYTREQVDRNAHGRTATLARIDKVLAHEQKPDNA